MEYSKVLVGGDLVRLTVPEKWMEFLGPMFEAEETQAVFRAVDCSGMFWEFRVARRDGPCQKPTIQARQWSAFVRYSGLQVGDKITVLQQLQEFRGTFFKITAHREGRLLFRLSSNL